MDAPELTTQHLRLRGWRPDDLDALAAMMGDPTTTRYLGHPPLDREEAADLLDEFAAEWQSHGFGRWAVEELASGELVGQCGFRRYDRGVGDFTLVIAPERRSRGFGTEAARRALRYGFDDLGLRRVVAYVHPANRHAQRIVDKLGMTHTESTVRAQGVRVMVYQLTELERRMRAH